MAEFEIGGRRYRSRAMDAMVAMDIARRYSSVLVWCHDLRAGSAKAGKPQTEKNMAKAMLIAAGPTPRGDQDFVVGACLNIVDRGVTTADGKTVAAWGAVRDAMSGTLMHADIDPAEIAEIVYRVLDEQGLVDFFSDPPQDTPGHRPA